jgi:hypothetical protein
MVRKRRMRRYDGTNESTQNIVTSDSGGSLGGAGYQIELVDGKTLDEMVVGQYI